MKVRIDYQELPSGFVNGMMQSESYLQKSGLDLKLMELIKYRVSQINGCAFCLDMHHKEAIHLGETELRLHSLAAWRECPYYNEKEHAVLAYTDALTNITSKDVDDEIYHGLSKIFSKNEIANLTLAITQINSWNRINIAFRTMPGTYVVGQFDK